MNLLGNYECSLVRGRKIIEPVTFFRKNWDLILSLANFTSPYPLSRRESGGNTYLSLDENSKKVSLNKELLETGCYVKTLDGIRPHGFLWGLGIMSLRIIAKTRGELSLGDRLNLESAVNAGWDKKYINDLLEELDTNKVPNSDLAEFIDNLLIKRFVERHIEPLSYDSRLPGKLFRKLVRIKRHELHSLKLKRKFHSREVMVS